MDRSACVRVRALRFACPADGWEWVGKNLLFFPLLFSLKYTKPTFYISFTFSFAAFFTVAVAVVIAGRAMPEGQVRQHLLCAVAAEGGGG